jgi:hypothetical protein
VALASLAAAAIGSYLATSERFNEAGPAPAEGQADMPADPATATEDDTRFVRDDATVEMPGSTQ